MPIHIRNREAESLARELAAMTGETITDAILIALEERLKRQRRRRTAATPSLREDILALGQRCASLPVLDERDDEAILGYDDHGLPG